MARSKLSEINSGIPASIWFETFNKQPDDIITDEESYQNAIEKILETGKKKYKKSSKAKDFFSGKAQLSSAPDDIINNAFDKKPVPVVLTENTLGVNSPKPIDVNVKSISNNSNLTSKQASLDSIHNKKKKDDIERLIDSMLRLTTTIEKSEKQRQKEQAKIDTQEPTAPSIPNKNEPGPRIPNKNEPGPRIPKGKKNKKNRSPRNDEEQSPKTWTDLFKTIARDKVDEVKDLVKIRNVLLTGGVESAMAGSGTILDRVLTFSENRSSDKIEKLTKSEVTPTSTEKKPESKGIVPKINKILGRSPGAFSSTGGVVPIETNASRGRAVSDAVALEKKTLIDTAKMPTAAQSLFAKMVPRFAKGEKSDIAPINIGSNLKTNAPVTQENLEDQILLKKLQVQPEIKHAIDHPDEPDNKEILEELRGGMREELVKLNEEQLAELKKVVARLDSSLDTREDKIEKLTKSEVTPISTEKKPEKENNKSLVKSLMNKLPKSGVKNILAKAGRLGIGALGVGAAGAAGYGIGSILNEKLISPAMELLTGTQGATLGTAIYDGVDKIKGWFGNSDADKQKAEEEKLKSVISSKSAPVQKVPASTATIAAANTATRVKQINKIQSTIRETNRIVENKKEKESKEKGVIDARSNITNNSTVVQHLRPAVKNEDSTFNHLLSVNFNH